MFACKKLWIQLQIPQSSRVRSILLINVDFMDFLEIFLDDIDLQSAMEQC